ncbi:uncharacterized protein [Centruroides vittatus]|uniref:uncharacterized protein n=1 Tax=Centruroides vittatus TaxID=120091 RepID=UPI00350F0EA9
MRASMLVLFIFTIAFSAINCMQMSDIGPENTYQSVSQAFARGCKFNKRQQRDFRFCLIENHSQILVEFTKNCIQQQAFSYTFGEMFEYLCCIQKTNQTKYQKFLECISSARYALSLEIPGSSLVLQECLLQAEKVC